MQQQQQQQQQQHELPGMVAVAPVCAALAPAGLVAAGQRTPRQGAVDRDPP
jgi:hypothetical protein